MNSQNLNVLHRYLFDNDKMDGSLFSQELHLGPAVLIFYTLVSVCLFSLLFFINLLSCQLGEFVQQSRACLVSDRFLYSPDLNHRASHRGLHD